MTLVVARITPLGVRMAADMRVIDRLGIQRGFVHAALKAVLLSPTLCIGYAGDVDAALRVIRQVASAAVGFDDARDRLLAAQRDSEGACEFLVAGLRPSRLAQIKAGNAVSDGAGWIGDAGAFGEYQLEYHRDQYLPPREMFDSDDQAEDIWIASRMKAAMDAVVEGPTSVGEGKDRVPIRPQGGRHEGVGEAVVMVVPRVEDDLFKYQVATYASAPPFPAPLPPGLGVVPPDFGSAERGSFAYDILRPLQPGVGALGVYIREGRLGLLYAPLLLDAPDRYPGTSLEQFVELVRLRHDFSLVGIAFGG